MCLSSKLRISKPLSLGFPEFLVCSWAAPLSFLLGKLFILFSFSLTPKVETEDQVLATFCGKETTDTEQTPGQEVVFSPGSFMSITFRSDFSNEERYTGFDAHYMAVGKLVK